MQPSAKWVQRLFMGLCVGGLLSCTSSPTQTAAPEATRPAPATSPPQTAATNSANAPACTLVESGFGPTGQVIVQVEEVVTGLDVPWGIAFLPDGQMLVSERLGQIRWVENGQLRPEPVATVNAADVGEGGLLGIAAHPEFATNRQFYVYYTLSKGGASVNRVERWQLATDRRSAQRDRIIIDDIPAARFHNGGRLRFGPDGMLYIGTGDARDPQIAQDRNSLAGKILRLTPDGQVPADNPFSGSPVFITGIRNTQGFDWLDESTLWVTDHGPSGELGRSGHDKVSVARAGDNLGWPTLQGCESRAGFVTPSITWRDAVPPGGAAIYRGSAIPEWQGSLMIGALGARHLHRVAFDPANPQRVQRYEVYFQGNQPNGYGRLREVIMGPDNELYVTTSNCDGRGNCPPGGDKILRITR